MIRESNSDTIVAISTPAGSAHRGIVRLSGENAITIASKIFRPHSAKSLRKTENFTAVSGTADVVQIGSVPAVIFLYRAPTSYTREDIVELHTFGSPVLLEAILSRFISLGARLAQPGEFTRRAFTAGRIDLAQAESVAQLISAQNSSEMRSAALALSGGLSEKIQEVSHTIRDSLALLESAIDFSDQDIDYISRDEIRLRLKESAKNLRSLLTKPSHAASGVRVAICGAPNVGKSSLFNCLVGRKRALTSPLPGTTRDTVSETVRIGPADFLLLDCAGDADSALPVEKLAAEQMRRYVQNADIALLVADSSKNLTKSEKMFFNQISCKKIFVQNKTDLSQSPHFCAPRRALTVKTSCITREGVLELRSVLLSLVKSGEVERSHSVIAATARQCEAIENALKSIRRAQESLSEGESEEFIALELREALSRLSEITGESVTESVLDAIFGRFCIGK
jgi:tRNA modification GTPase